MSSLIIKQNIPPAWMIVRALSFIPMAIVLYLFFSGMVDIMSHSRIETVVDKVDLSQLIWRRVINYSCFVFGYVMSFVVFDFIVKKRVKNV